MSRMNACMILMEGSRQPEDAKKRFKNECVTNESTAQIYRTFFIRL